MESGKPARKDRSEDLPHETEELKAEVVRLQGLVLQLEQSNAEQKAQIARLQKDRARKAPPPPPTPPTQESSSAASETSENASKIDQFLRFFNSKTVKDSELLLHGVNFLISVYQMVYAKERDEDQNAPNPASRIAFNYVLEFMRQINARHITDESVGEATKVPDFSYPINWLISLFPYADGDAKGSDCVWMPLHFAVAIDSTSPGFDNDAYLAHLETLLVEYGPTAFDEDVSPLSVAVSTARPNLDAVRLILEYRPDSVRKVDEDGSLPFMHACANNVDLETIEFLYEQYPAAVDATDNYGCGAIHYAAFYGTPKAVSFLLQVAPTCAGMVEGNGAFPLHDAVQNTRNSGSIEMVEMLLQVNPGAARKRDDYGAFPLHMAAKAAALSVVKLVHESFPKAVYGPDSEGLLPMHYVAERHDKDQHLDLLQYILQANPQSQTMDDAALFAVDPDPATTATQGGWRGALKSMWGGGSSSSASSSSTAAAKGAQAATAATGSGTATGGAGTGRFASAAASPPAPAHNRRKSVRPVRGSIHEQYKRK